MALRYQNFQPVEYGADRHSFGAALAVVAKRGMIVSRVAGSADTVQLATNTTGYFLRTDVVADLAALQSFLDADVLRPGKGGFRTPVVVGAAVQCEEFPEVWVEGTDLLGAGMDNTVTAGTPLTTAAGKWVPVTDSTTQETFGIVRRNIAGLNGGARRMLIEVVRNAKVVEGA